MQCDDLRSHLLDRARGKLDSGVLREVEAHLESCEACRKEEAADAELSVGLGRLPKRTAPPSLVRSLRPRQEPRRGRALLLMAAGAALALAVVFVWRGAPAPAHDTILSEAVNDHLRVLYSDHPLEVASSDSHTVKPWFTGRLDFAPVVAFEGDADFPLEGGAVGYFIDRKAAVYEYRRKLHVISLFVFRAEGLDWPTEGLQPLGRARASVQSSRGFHVVSWRDRDLGYALVSDVSEQELVTLGGKIAGG